MKQRKAAPYLAVCFAVKNPNQEKIMHSLILICAIALAFMELMAEGAEFHEDQRVRDKLNNETDTWRMDNLRHLRQDMARTARRLVQQFHVRLLQKLTEIIRQPAIYRNKTNEN